MLIDKACRFTHDVSIDIYLYDTTYPQIVDNENMAKKQLGYRS
ncbi:MAG: hypothetical protein P9L91_05755 [Candidatus Zophobacter franzmannii]|nr:hypothetical protein [Candidatus Zophobacter franzmannii]